jgi:hypothetical protein
MVGSGIGTDKRESVSCRAAGWSVRRGSWLFSSGYPIWFRVLIGVLEIAAAALLVWPRTAAVGAASSSSSCSAPWAHTRSRQRKCARCCWLRLEGDFFTTHHYGRGRFERDAAGRGARLVYTEGPHEFVATRL